MEEQQRSYVYRHRRLDTNEIFYIGKGTKRKSKTFYKHEAEFCRAYKKEARNKYWKNIVGYTDYSVEIVADNLTNADACELEVFLISIYKRIDCCGGTLVNYTDGGEGVTGFIFNDDSIKKMSDNGKGKLHTQETKDKISKSSKGKVLTTEHRQNLSVSHTGKKMSNEAIDKMKLNNIGKMVSQETKNKMSEAHKGEKHPMAKQILCILDGIFYSTIKEGCIAYNLNYKTTYRKLFYNKSNDSIFILI